jgi:FMN phosphatase YigB (HAD superfamily)
MKAFLFDMDGTLVNTDHRVHHLEKTPKDWDAWHGLAHLDTPHAGVAAIANALALENFRIIICTGREARLRRQTEDWLRLHAITYHRIFMRADGDRRDDDVVKREMLFDIREDGFEVLGVFEDRARVVRMWRDEALMCFQVAPGEF